MPYDVLVIDDETDIRDLISDALEDEGYKTRSAAESISAFNLINEYVPDVLILDIWLQGSELDGLGILEIVKKKYPYMPVIIISGHGTIETAVSAIKIGAYDYIEKPFTEDKLLVTVKRACETSKLLKENAELRIGFKYKTELIGESQAITQLKSLIEKIAPTASRVLISGASGTGKELVARYIHKKSKRFKENFVIFNPSGMTVDKVQIELFGDNYTPGIHDKARKIGLLELASSGTLFIDEVGDLPPIIQNKILKFLQDQNFERPGTNKTVKLDVRIIASTSRDLQKDIKEGKFKEDLFYRLNIVHIKLPNLSERKDDIAALSDHFIKFFAETSGLSPRLISKDALRALSDYSWPGNVRQLRNIIEWLLIVAQGDSNSNDPIVINSEILPPEILNNKNTIIKPDKDSDVMLLPLREAREIFEKQYLTAQMNRFNGNISKTSNFVGMERSALHRKLKSLNIHANNVIIEEETLA